MPGWRAGATGTRPSVTAAASTRGTDEDGDGLCEVPVTTMAGVWSLPRARLRPRRGVSQAKPPLYLGFFQFAHDARRRGKALLGEPVAAPVA
jgi:transposase